MGVAAVNAMGDGGGLGASTLVAMAAVGGFAALMWSTYFDRFSPGIEHFADSVEGNERSRFVRDPFTWSHTTIIGSVIALAAALEEALLHPPDHLHSEFLSMFVASITKMLIGSVLAIYCGFRVVAVERIIGCGVFVVLAFLASDWNALCALERRGGRERAEK